MSPEMILYPKDVAVSCRIWQSGACYAFAAESLLGWALVAIICNIYIYIYMEILAYVRRRSNTGLGGSC